MDCKNYGWHSDNRIREGGRLLTHYLRNLAKKKSRALLFFHAFSGCDNVSVFKGKRRKMLFQTWSNFPEATQTFMKLSSQHQMVNSHDLNVLEKFTVMLYERSSSESNMDSTRRTLFTQKNRPYNLISRLRFMQKCLRQDNDVTKLLLCCLSKCY